MKPNKTTLRETRRVAVGVLALVGVMLVVFAVIGKLDWRAACGGVYTGLLGVGNFFLMGMTVQSITETAAEKQRTEEELDHLSQQMEAKMKLSRNGRMLALLALVVVGITLLRFHPLATIIPVVFPSVVVKLLQIIDIRKASSAEGGEKLEP